MEIDEDLASDANAADNSIMARDDNSAGVDTESVPGCGMCLGFYSNSIRTNYIAVG